MCLTNNIFIEIFVVIIVNIIIVQGSSYDISAIAVVYWATV